MTDIQAPLLVIAALMVCILPSSGMICYDSCCFTDDYQPIGDCPSDLHIGADPINPVNNHPSPVYVEKPLTVVTTKVPTTIPTIVTERKVATVNPTSVYTQTVVVMTTTPPTVATAIATTAPTTVAIPTTGSNPVVEHHGLLDGILEFISNLVGMRYG